MTDSVPPGKTVFVGPRVELRVVEVEGRGGTAVPRELVVHPGSVAILPLTAAGQIVMIRNWRFSVAQELWELPAGTRQGDEPPEACAARELREETGYVAAGLRKLGELLVAPALSTERMHAYVATGLTHVGQDLDADERIRPAVMDADEVRRLIRTGQIVDSKTLAVLGLYWWGEER